MKILPTTVCVIAHVSAINRGPLEACAWLSRELSVLGVCLAWYRAGLGIKSCLVCADHLPQSISHSPSRSHIHHFLCHPGPIGRLCFPKIDSAVYSDSAQVHKWSVMRKPDTAVHGPRAAVDNCTLLHRIAGKTGSKPSVRILVNAN